MKKNLFICLILAFMSGLWSIESNAQSTTNNNTWVNGDFLGYTGTTHTLDFGFGAGPTLYMKLLTSGDLNMVVGTNGYKINNNYVLWHNNITSNIYVGVSAGNVANTGNNVHNSFMGNSAGTTDNYGSDNSALGFQALNSNDSMFGNVAVGSGALYALHSQTPALCQTCYSPYYSGNSAVGVGALANTQAYGGCALGYWAAQFNTTGCGLVAIGEQALYKNNTGTYNIGIGEGANYWNKTGGYNTIVGADAGGGYGVPSDTTTRINHSNDCFFGASAGEGVKNDSDNVFVGFQSGTNNTYASENTAVGYKSLYTQSYNGGSTPALWNSYNTAIGDGALYSNQPTSTSNGIDNTALGHQAGYSNQTGNYSTMCGYQAGYKYTNPATYSGNDFFGFEAGYSTTTSYGNVCIGIESGYSNTASYETFVGNVAGQNNTTGVGNTFVGFACGGSNTTGSNNTFVGIDAGNKGTTAGGNSGLGFDVLYNATGASNTAVGWEAGYTATTGNSDALLGYQAGYSLTTGSSNTALGYNAGYYTTTGDSDTFVGYNAGVASGNGAFNNCAAFGYGATATASDQITIGNTNVTSIGGNANWTKYSDGRFKINVKNENIGLDFIRKLRPVTYNMDTKALDAFMNPNRPQQAVKQTDSLGNTIITPAYVQGDFSASTSIVQSGFIAQEVDSVAKACGFTSSIVKVPANSNDPYGLNYAEFVVPLVRAVQQLDSINKGLAAKMQTQDSVINSLQTQINNCCAVNQRKSSQSDTSTINVTLSNTGGIILNGNDPNPFSENTTITFNIPSSVNEAKIIFYDNLGHIINTVIVNDRGPGKLDVYASDLSSGIYSYSLLADGNVIDTKRMVRMK